MSSDPIPQKSARLFTTIIDNGQPENYNPNEPNLTSNELLSYIDAANLVKSAPVQRKVALYGIGGVIEPARADMAVLSTQGMATSLDFFGMMDVNFLYGQAWSEADDKVGADVVVISNALSEKLFGAANPVGQRIRLNSFDYQIVGVMNNFNPLPHYYRLIGGPDKFGDEDDLFIPFSSAVRNQINPQGNMDCTGKVEPGPEGIRNSDCTWIQFWFETKSAADRAELQDYLNSYASEQRKLGRMQRTAPNPLYNVMEWLSFNKVVGNDSKLSAWLAFGFLLLCLVNTIGLLLAKFSVRAAEVGIRRALGASRRDIFRQFLVETAVVGLAGGILGLLLATAALMLIAMQSKEMGTIAHMDWTMLAFTFVLSVFAAVLAGLLPTWRACQVTPAMQLKSQ
jgi:putative ABC transport system permease protein